MRILIVDDAQTNCKLLATLLERAGHCAVTAVDGDDAQKHFQVEQFDGVLTDLHLTPACDGVQLARNLRQMPNGKSVRIALMTADVPEEMNVDGPFDAILGKPVKLQDILNFLEGAK